MRTKPPLPHRSSTAPAPLRIIGVLICAWLVGCGPKADPVAEETCPYCTNPQTSNRICYLDIQNQIADQEKIVCTLPDEAFHDAACAEACATWTANNTKACLDYSLGGAFLCHDSSGDDGTAEGASVGGSDGADPGADTTAGAMIWDPSSYVVWDSQLDVYIVDSYLVDMLKYDASLLENDPTYLDEVTGGFAFKGVTPNSLAAELGFQENDIPLTVNGHYVRTLDEVLAALGAVYDDTALTVRFQRGGTTMSHDYLIR